MALNGPTYYPQYCTVIAHNVEHCGFGSTLPLEESHITPGDNLPPVWEPLPQVNTLTTALRKPPAEAKNRT